MADMKRFAQLNRDYKDLRKIVEQYELYKNILSNIDTNKEILATEKDAEFRAMAREELDQLIEDRDQKEEEIRLMLIPKDPAAATAALVEIRGGAGGDDASLFAGGIYRMYMRTSSDKGWQTELRR